MKVKFFGSIKIITGETEREIRAENVESLLGVLCAIYGPELTEILFHEKNLRKNVVILRNGKNIHREQGFATPLGERDVVCIFPPLGGG